jgi:predicted ester cyclase
MSFPFFVSRSRAWQSLAVAALFTSVACTAEPPPPPPPAAPAVKTAEARVQLYQDCWRTFNEKQFDQFQNCYAENAVSEAPDGNPSSITGRTAIVDRAKVEATGFPDRRGEVRLILANGSRIASIALYTGTNTGEMPGPDGKPAKPTGKPVGLLLGHVLDFDATGSYGVRDAAYIEEATLAAQLGHSPAPARKAEKPTGATATVVIAKNDATESANLAATRSGFEAFNKHDLKAMDEMTPDGYKLIEIGQAKDMNKKEALASLKEMFSAFPDVTVTAPTMWAAGDYVVSEGSLTGTNTGDLKSMGMKKTGKKVNVRFLQIARYENGRVMEEWLFYNGAAFAAQLGLK